MANSITCSTSTSICYSTPPQPNSYFDEKWKLSKREGSSSISSSSSSSSSRSSSCSSSSQHNNHHHGVMKNSCSSSSRHHHHNHKKRCDFASKCGRLVKEQRARFYIMRRCVIMLICWRHYSDS